VNRRTAATIAVLLLALAGCGSRDSGSLGTLPTEQPAPASPSVSPAVPSGGLGARPSEPNAPPGEPGQPPPTGTLTIQVWFTQDGALFPTSRTKPYTVATSQLAMDQLKAGPSAVERSAGLANGIASNLDFEVSVAGGVATVDLPSAFYTGGEDVARLRQAQVVFTLTQFPTVSTVGFQRDGEALAAPVGRSAYEDLLPLIVVTSPVIGQRVSSPVTVAGTANVFEATVSVRILDASGAEVATTFTTATCGSGCRGTYRVSVPYQVVTEQAGTVQVYQVSPEDGSRTHVVDIPVTLASAR
jgi:immunoglobulin-like protein involved in spore germination/sporulation and spore germination protein